MSQIMIHYGELSTKGHNRKSFQNRIAEHIRSKTQAYEKVKILAFHDYMHLFFEIIPEETMIRIISKIPGISRFEPVYPVEKDLQAIQALAFDLFKTVDPQVGQTFKVVAKRSDKTFEHDTLALQREVGHTIFEGYPGLKVSMKHPDHKLVVSIHQDSAYLSLKSYPGMGGLPYGSSGKGLLMLSGGFDSPIAGYQMIKRGMAIECVHFASPPYTSPQALEKAKRLTAVLASFSKPIMFHQVPFAHVQLAIRDTVPDALSMTIMRRIMIRIMDRLLDQCKAQAIVNGESLGQVASQTIHSMSVIEQISQSLILRPLIATDKNDIIKLAEEIGTFAISNEPYEDCCTVFAPKSPWTKPRLHTVEEYEAKLDIEHLVEEALQQLTSTLIDEDYQSQAQATFSELL